MKLPNFVTKIISKLIADPSEWKPSPMISRDDALRLGEQILAMRPITVNDINFVTNHIIGGMNPSLDKDLYLLVESVDQKRSIEIVLYKGADRSEFNYCVGSDKLKKGEDVYKIIDAEGNILEALIPQQ